MVRISTSASKPTTSRIIREAGWDRHAKNRFTATLSSQQTVIRAKPLKEAAFQKGPMPVPKIEEHTSELQSPCNLVCRLLLEKKKKVDDKVEHINAPCYDV